MEKEHTKNYWLAYIEMLARNRFNRLNLVFAHQTDYLAPPYPFWITVPKFPKIKPKNGEHQAENLAMLQYISQTAADHGIDFTLGIWEHNIQPNMKPSVDGLTRENIGPYSYEALKAILTACPAIRSVQMRTNSESGIPTEQQVAFYRDYVFKAIKDSGRLVTLDLRGWLMSPGLMDAAKNAGVPLRLSSKYWAEDLGRPYQPAETWANYSYINFLEKPRPYQFYWELWGLGSHRLLLWGDPDYVRRAVPTFTMSDTYGFEIDPPLAQKGFGNAPGAWQVPSPGKYEFERYWMFYTLWGRLSYDPKTGDKVWLTELQRRFGTAAPDVMAAYHHASQVLSEIVAVHLADPNMYIWPEINPGGLIDAYCEVKPSDWAFVASIPEAVHNRIRGIASAKQTPVMTATRLQEFSIRIEQAVERAAKLIDPANKEWKSTQTDFLVLAALAKYHARKQLAADHLTYFYETGNDSGLYAAQRELRGAARVWERLVKLTDGVYPPNMSFGPDDKGHWKDKLPFVQHDLKTMEDRVKLYERFGRFEYGFDFGGPVAVARGASYRNDPYVLRNTVEPRFQPVDPVTIYSDERGYGFMGSGAREAVPQPTSPYLTVRAVSTKQLPENALFGDSIRGRGTQLFRVSAPAGKYKVIFLEPDKTTHEETLTAKNGHLDIGLPAADWTLSGLIIKKTEPDEDPEPQHWPATLPRPAIEHTPAPFAIANQPLTIALKVNRGYTIRLHYRAVNQLAKFKTIENDKGQFTIPAEDISLNWDLMYYFEILNKEGGGWFHPDPLTTTPYYVVKVQLTPPPKDDPGKPLSVAASK
jgi:hypothetical protein